MFGWFLNWNCPFQEEPRGEARKEGGKRGRRPGRKVAPERVDMKAKLGNCEDFQIGKCSFLDILWQFDLFTERSRQSARECRARKKLRYQYLEELVTDREKAVFALRKELEKVYTDLTFWISVTKQRLTIFPTHFFSIRSWPKSWTKVAFLTTFNWFWKKWAFWKKNNFSDHETRN